MPADLDWGFDLWNPLWEAAAEHNLVLAFHIGTGGELLVHQLVAQGVKYAFTNTGSAEAGFFNALLTVPGVQPILLLAESLVLSAADGYAKASREAAFCGRNTCATA